MQGHSWYRFGCASKRLLISSRDPSKVGRDSMLLCFLILDFIESVHRGFIKSNLGNGSLA